MKFALLLLLSFGCFSVLGQSSDAKNKIQQEADQLLSSLQLDEVISTGDTMMNMTAGVQIIRFYDDDNNLLKVRREFLYGEDDNKGPWTKIYNKSGNKIYEALEDVKGNIWHLYVYTYTRGKLVSEKGFSENQNPHEITYQYDESGNLLQKDEQLLDPQ